MRFAYLNRTLCDVLDEMRKADETKNYSYLTGLIEEAQSMGNRMEDKLETIRDHERLKKKLKDKLKKLNEIESKIEELESV